MTYRREIDGLRGLAVVPVIFFHAGFPWFRGGFVGVDVFFVISGYLITTLITTEKDAGTFSIATFYERRARRILPALVLVMLACLLPAWLWMLPDDLSSFSRSVAAVSVFSSNVLFNAETNYFGPAIERKPLLHTWSLSIEEQFYVVFPIAILAVWWMRRRWLMPAIALAALGSLLLAHLGGNFRTSPPFVEDAWRWVNVPTWGFYLLPARAWELLVGALAALALEGRAPRNTRTSHVLSLAGVAMILYAIVTFDASTPFPSFYTLIPVMGTALVVLTATPGTFGGRCLLFPPLVAAGLVSYSAYLWHQPLFAFARLRSFEKPSDGLLAGLCAATFVLAYLSWKLVEQPFRDRRRFTRRTIFSSALVASGGLFALGALGVYAEGFEGRWTLPPAVKASLSYSPRVTECFDLENAHRAETWFCDVVSDGTLKGALHGAPHSFVVAGDSHMLSTLPAFERAAAELGVNGLATGISGCPPLLDVYTLTDNKPLRDCHQLNRRVFDHVRRERIPAVFLVSRWTHYTDGGYDGDTFGPIGVSPGAPATRDRSREAFRRGLEATLAAYASIGTHVYVVLQVPEQPVVPDQLYYRAYRRGGDIAAFITRTSVDVERHRRLQEYVRTLFHEHGKDAHVTFISLDELLCGRAKCLIGTVERSYYSDANHLSNDGAFLAAPAVKTHLAAALGR